MTVYVDDYPGWFRNQLWSHMIADSTEELVEMALKIGLKKERLQNGGTYHEHFVVSPNMKAKALKEGAVPVTTQRAAEIGWERRKKVISAMSELIEHQGDAQKKLYKGVKVSEESLKHCVIGDSCSGMKDLEKFKGRRLLVKESKGEADA